MNPDDFTFDQGESVSAQIIVDDPNVSLYCLDDAHRQALFVELPPGVDLSRPPFYYQAQFEQARHLIAVPYETVHALADTLPPLPRPPILVFSTGRCGSTLLSKVFNQLERVVSLSEPDVFTQLVYMRGPDRTRDAELIALLRDCMRLTCRPTGDKRLTVYAIKFRNQCTQIADLFDVAFPGTRHLFMYRNAVDWVASFYRLMQRYGMPETIAASESATWLSRYFGCPVDMGRLYGAPLPDVLPQTESLAMSWLVTMERYLALYEQGVSFAAIRYEELVARPERMVSALFAHSGLGQDEVAQSLTVFERDAQRGTALARDQDDQGNAVRLSETQVAGIRALLGRHPTIRTPDWIAPGTLG